MTFDKIKKGLECCATFPRESKCDNCTACVDGKCAIKPSEILNLINRQKAKIDNLEYTLLGVMHFVDKWLDGDELEQDEVKRSEIMREKTLKIMEEQQVEVERLKEGFKKLVEKQNLCKENTQATREYQIKQTKSEVIKEFAERFLKIVCDNHYMLSSCNNSKDYGMFATGIEQAINEAIKETENKIDV